MKTHHYCQKKDIKEFVDYYDDLYYKRVKEAKKLFEQTNAAGLIIGEVCTGDVINYGSDSKPVLGTPIIDYQLWNKKDWIASPGGLGVRKVPKK